MTMENTATRSRRLGVPWRRFCGSATVLILLFVAVASASDAAPLQSPATNSWLASQIAEDGSVLDPYTSEPSVDWSVNVAIGLAATGDRSDALGRALRHIQDNAEAYITSGTSDPVGHLSWLIILAIATGLDPHSFGPTSIDLIDRVNLRYSVAEPGLFGTVDEYTPVTNHSLAILALVAAGETVEEGAIDWLLSQQCGGPVGQIGAWQGHRDIGAPGSLVDCLPITSTAYERPETGSTSYAVQALVAVRESGYVNTRVDAAVERAVEWFRGMQADSGTASGGFGQYVGDPADPNSTALVILALLAAGVDPSTMVADGNDPFVSLRHWLVTEGPDAGSLSSPYSSGAADLFATFQALWGFAADPFPILPSTVAVEEGSTDGTPGVWVPVLAG